MRYVAVCVDEQEALQPPYRWDVTSSLLAHDPI